MSHPLIAMGTDGICRPLAAPPYLAEVPITGSVGVGGLNNLDDIRTIQDALNEVSPTSGGPSPSLVVTGQMDQKTIAAIKKFQMIACKMRVPDGRVDRGRLTHQTLARFYIVSNPYTIQLVYLYLPEALSWILAAERALDEAIGRVSGSFASSNYGYDLASKFFHIDQLPRVQAVVELDRLRRIYRRMQTVIGHRSALTTFGSGYFQADGLSNDAFAYTFYGGYDRGPVMSSVDDYAGPDQRQDTIYFCTRMINPRATRAIINAIVHELAHFVGPGVSSPDRIGDHSYFSQPEFFKLSPYLALRTADCFSCFAGHAKIRAGDPKSS
ncbi:MAG TPA: hypothetical protein VG457_02370 [Planctomycetota bacterium]|jgi:hypothetical protein|nr:hypothetical protein [Planctomycetota bacterium]